MTVDITTHDVTVRYFAGARAATGVDEERIPLPAGATLTLLADDVGGRHGPALQRVLAVASFLVDGVGGPRDRTIPAGAVVDVLPPFAGG